jgi:DNA-binding transcriptional LysR family regulator
LELHEPLRRMLNDITALVRQNQSFDPLRSDKTFRVMATDYMHRIVSLSTMRGLSDAAPNIRLAMVMYDAKRAWRSMEDDEVDVLISSDRLTPPDAKAHVLVEEGFVLVQRKGHPRGVRAIDLDEFCELEHILVSPEGGGFYGATDKALDRLGRKRRVAASLPSFLLAAPLVASTDMVTVLPERLALSMRDEFDILPLPFESPRFNIVMSWHPRLHQDPAQQWLRQMVSRSFGGGAAEI